MTYPRVIFCFLFLLTAAFTKAQDNLSPEKVKELNELHQSIKGTYQIQMRKRGLQPEFPLILVEKIERYRTDSVVAYFDACSLYRIMVLPRSVIESEGFIPLKLISYVTDEDRK